MNSKISRQPGFLGHLPGNAKILVANVKIPLGNANSRVGNLNSCVGMVIRRKSKSLLLILILPLLAPLSGLSAQFKFPSQTFTVPGGFEVEMVAGPPLVERPVSAFFDEQGRLYVTDSSGSNEKPDKQLETKPHRVVRLEDTHGDGNFDKSIVFADKMMFPEGCLWFDGSLYVAAPPSIWKLTDTNHDGVADIRTEWHQGKTLTGCANDLHGPFLGPDGWIYWCKGAFAEQSYVLPDGKAFTSRAAHIFRARSDHSHLEPVLTGGMDNPVGLTFTPDGERILCGTFFVHPEAGKRDGLIHAIYGGVYGKPNEVTDSHAKTGDLMPVMTHMGPAAPCSVIRYQSKAFGKDYEDNLFVCSFNLHKVSRHILEPDGATYRTRDIDFLVSDNPDFHPTDVIEDADGSLLVVDTGGWYKICCPTSQLSKPDVLGAIYRVRRISAPKPTDPRGLKLALDKASPAELTKLLEDERPVVRNRAIELLTKRGSTALPALATAVTAAPSPDGRINAIWSLTRIEDPQARAAVRKALDDSQATVRHAAICSVGLWRDPVAVDPLIKLLPAELAANRRAIAEALGRIGRSPASDSLLETIAASGPMDRVQEHSFIYALIELGSKQDLLRHARSSNIAVRRAAFIALDQIRGSLKPEMIAPLLASPQPILRETGSWIAGHHPEWGWALADFFRKRLDADPDGNDELKQQLAQFTGSDAIQQLIALVLNKEETPTTTRQFLLDVIGGSGLKEPPSSWAGAVTWCLAQTDENLLRSAVSAARVVAHAKARTAMLGEALLHVASDETHPPELRLEALAALPNGLPTVEPGLFKLLRAYVDPSKPVLVRNAAATTLARAKLTDDQLVSVAENLKISGPLETPKLLTAFEHSGNETVGLALTAALKESKSRSALRPEVLKPLLAKYPSSVQEQGKNLLVSLNVDAGKQSAHLDELLPTLKDGDIRRGQALFNSPKAACSSCHSIGYLGGKVGPDLTSIGQVRTERDLLESIVYPSASFVRSFEPYIVGTKNGEEISGVLRKDAPDELVLATGPGTEVRISRADIEGMRPGTVSIMPAGLEEQLTRQELADLIAFLKATKWGPQ